MTSTRKRIAASPSALHRRRLGRPVFAVVGMWECRRNSPQSHTYHAWENINHDHLRGLEDTIYTLIVFCSRILGDSSVADGISGDCYLTRSSP